MKSIYKSIALLTGLTVAMIGTATAELKVASVNMQKLLGEYHKSKKVQEFGQIELATIQKKNMERQTAIKEIEEEIQKFRKMIKDPSLSDSKRLKIENDAKRRINDGNALARELQEFNKRKRLALKEELDARMLLIIAEVQNIVSETVAAKDIDFILDSSGFNSSGRPMIVYSKDKYDITGEVLAALNKLAAEE